MTQYSLLCSIHSVCSSYKTSRHTSQSSLIEGFKHLAWHGGASMRRNWVPRLPVRVVSGVLGRFQHFCVSLCCSHHLSLCFCASTVALALQQAIRRPVSSSRNCLISAWAHEHERTTALAPQAQEHEGSAWGTQAQEHESSLLGTWARRRKSSMHDKLNSNLQQLICR